MIGQRGEHVVNSPPPLERLEDRLLFRGQIRLLDRRNSRLGETRRKTPWLGGLIGLILGAGHGVLFLGISFLGHIARARIR